MDALRVGEVLGLLPVGAGPIVHGGVAQVFKVTQRVVADTLEKNDTRKAMTQGMEENKKKMQGIQCNNRKMQPVPK